METFASNLAYIYRDTGLRPYWILAVTYAYRQLVVCCCCFLFYMGEQNFIKTQLNSTILTNNYEKFSKILMHFRQCGFRVTVFFLLALYRSKIIMFHFTRFLRNDLWTDLH